MTIKEQNRWNAHVPPHENAHELPYMDESVDAVYCEAVLEHLGDPARAVSEMWRVLKPGGGVYACTPFIQGYHGYPHHYHNFTLTGHQRLFTSQGFRVSSAGACVGPVGAVFQILALFLHQYVPRLFRLPARALLSLFELALMPLNPRLGARPDGHVLASTTYLVAFK